MTKEKARDLRMLFFVREDLNMSLGKTAAQVGHGVADLMIANFHSIQTQPGATHEQAELFEDWIEGHSVKITLRVTDEDELLEFYELGKRLGFPTVLVTDKGFTELEGDNHTVVGWGPVHKLDHHNYTSHLKLL